MVYLHNYKLLSHAKEYCKYLEILQERNSDYPKINKLETKNSNFSSEISNIKVKKFNSFDNIL